MMSAGHNCLTWRLCLEGVPHLTRLHQRALVPWLDHYDGTRGVAADRGRRPAQEDIEEAALAMGPNDQQVDPQGPQPWRRSPGADPPP